MEGINPTQLSRAVAHLLEGGLIERTSDQGDRRAAWVKATPRAGACPSGSAASAPTR